MPAWPHSCSAETRCSATCVHIGHCQTPQAPGLGGPALPATSAASDVFILHALMFMYAIGHHGGLSFCAAPQLSSALGHLTPGSGELCMCEQQQWSRLKGSFPQQLGEDGISLQASSTAQRMPKSRRDSSPRLTAPTAP